MCGARVNTIKNRKLLDETSVNRRTLRCGWFAALTHYTYIYSIYTLFLFVIYSIAYNIVKTITKKVIPAMIIPICWHAPHCTFEFASKPSIIDIPEYADYYICYAICLYTFASANPQITSYLIKKLRIATKKLLIALKRYTRDSMMVWPCVMVTIEFLTHYRCSQSMDLRISDMW